MTALLTQGSAASLWSGVIGAPRGSRDIWDITTNNERDKRGGRARSSKLTRNGNLFLFFKEPELEETDKQPLKALEQSQKC